MKWRPIHTAPKDTDVLLCYLGADQRPFVRQGRWVDVPHCNALDDALMRQRSVPRADPHWEAVGIAIQIHFTNASRSYRPDSFYVQPTHWMPLPEPAKGCYKRWFQLSPTLQ